MKDIVLIVDDIAINRMILREILCREYELLEASNGREALDLMMNAQEPIAAALLDIVMPEMDGFEVLRAMKCDAKTERIPVLIITAEDASAVESRCLHEGAVDFIAKPFNPDVIKARVDNHISLSRYQSGLERLVELKTQQLERIYEQTMETLATIIEYRSLESGIHITRTRELTRLFIEELLTRPAYSQQLYTLNYRSIIKAVALHDIGKVGIEDSILLKPGALTKEEFERVKQHAAIGGDIIDMIARNLEDDSMYLRHCKDICLYHHERWDGSGYPAGLQGEQIPLSARIVSIVDVYDALVNTRCYKPAYTHEEAVALIAKGRGTQFDPGLVDAYLDIAARFWQMEDALNRADLARTAQG